MDADKKDAMIRTLPLIFFISIVGVIRLYSYLLSGDIYVWTAFILVIVCLSVFSYFGLLFRIRDTKRVEKLTSDEFFEMHKRRMIYFFMFSVIMLIVTLVILDWIFKLYTILIIIFVFMYLILILMLIFSWYKGAKKMAEEKKKRDFN